MASGQEVEFAESSHLSDGISLKTKQHALEIQPSVLSSLFESVEESRWLNPVSAPRGAVERGGAPSGGVFGSKGGGEPTKPSALVTETLPIARLPPEAL